MCGVAVSYRSDVMVLILTFLEVSYVRQHHGRAVVQRPDSVSCLSLGAEKLHQRRP